MTLSDRLSDLFSAEENKLAMNTSVDHGLQRIPTGTVRR
jgi:hypothetical protein